MPRGAGAPGAGGGLGRGCPPERLRPRQLDFGRAASGARGAPVCAVLGHTVWGGRRCQGHGQRVESGRVPVLLPGPRLPLGRS